MKPICFMIMPYKKRKVGDSSALPQEIDFDALWNKAFAPAIAELGYHPVRADQDLGALIISEMLERLVLSDLVLADMTLPNGNVYYEVGLRHAAVRTGCVLIGAEKSKQLFDVDQMRHLRYPLPEGKITEKTAKAIVAALKKGVPKLLEGISPMHQALPGYPDRLDPKRMVNFRETCKGLGEFRKDLAAVYLLPEKRRGPRARALKDAYINRNAMTPFVALELLYLLRDVSDWESVVKYVQKLPDQIRCLPVVKEQECLARAKLGDDAGAIGAITELILVLGNSPERQGLLGGRYKALHEKSLQAGRVKEGMRYLHKSIEHYELGMKMDLNAFFPSSNLPRLLRLRDGKGDRERAEKILVMAKEACLRAAELDPSDGWIRLTLLGLAFDEGNAEAASDLVEEIRRETTPGWMLETTFKDLHRSIAWRPDGDEFKSVAAGMINGLRKFSAA